MLLFQMTADEGGMPCFWNVSWLAMLLGPTGHLWSLTALSPWRPTIRTSEPWLRCISGSLHCWLWLSLDYSRETSPLASNCLLPIVSVYTCALPFPSFVTGLDYLCYVLLWPGWHPPVDKAHMTGLFLHIKYELPITVFIKESFIFFTAFILSSAKTFRCFTYSFSLLSVALSVESQKS